MSKQKPEPTTFLLVNAQKMLEDGHTELSLNLYRQAISARPNDIRGYIGAGIAAIEASRFDEALDVTERGLVLVSKDQSQPENIETLRARWMLSQAKASALAELGQYGDAVRLAKLAYDLNPCPEARIELATTLAISGHLEEAEEQYALGLLDTSSPELASITYGNMGKLFEGNGEVDSALKYFQTAVISDPNNSQARIDLARALAGRGRFDEAVIEIEKIKMTDLYYHEAHQTADLIQHGQEVISEIFSDEIPRLESLIQGNNPPAANYLSLASVYLESQQTINAITTLRAGLKHYPSNLAIILMLADILVDRKFLAQLRPLISEALQTDSSHPQLNALNTLLWATIHQRHSTLEAYAKTQSLLSATTTFALEPWERTIETNRILPSRRKCCNYLVAAFATLREWKLAVDCIFDLHEFIATSYQPPSHNPDDEGDLQRPFQNKRLEPDEVETIRTALKEQHLRCDQLLSRITANPSTSDEITNSDSLVALLSYVLMEADETIDCMVMGLDEPYNQSEPLVGAFNHYYPKSRTILDDVLSLREDEDPEHTNPDWGCLRKPALDIIKEQIQ